MGFKKQALGRIGFSIVLLLLSVLCFIARPQNVLADALIINDGRFTNINNWWWENPQGQQNFFSNLYQVSTFPYFDENDNELYIDIIFVAQQNSILTGSLFKGSGMTHVGPYDPSFINPNMNYFGSAWSQYEVIFSLATTHSLQGYIYGGWASLYQGNNYLNLGYGDNISMTLLPGVYTFSLGAFADLQCPDGFFDFSLTLNEVATTPVPEPGTLFLVGTGMVGLAFRRRKFLLRKS